MSKQAKGKGSAFFERADKVAETGNWDYAIDMYLQGLGREPGNIEHGHKALRYAAMKRLEGGGKPGSMMDKLKRRNAKTPEDTMANALFLLSKEPGAVDQLDAAAKAAHELELPEVARFYTTFLFDTQKHDIKKADKKILVSIVKSLIKLEDYSQATEAAVLAKKLAPNDPDISALEKETATQFAIKKGKYDEKGKDSGFTGNVKDMEAQKKLIAKDSTNKSQEYLLSQSEKAHSEYLADPDTPGKINAYIDALIAFDDAQRDDQAIAVLHDIHERTKTYRYKVRMGDIRIRVMTRKERELKAAGDDTGAKQMGAQRLAFELEEFSERVVNYPTDLAMKYELGRRLLMAKQYDKAIAVLQAAQNDPRRRLKALANLGQAFYLKGLKREAVDTYRRALEGDVRENDQKNLRYLLGVALEATGDLDGAAEELSLVAQMDYGYKDASKRLEAIRTRKDD